MAELSFTQVVAATFLGSGVGTSLFMFFLQSNKEYKALLRSKLESVYADFDKFSNAHRTLISTFRDYAEKRIDLKGFMTNIQRYQSQLGDPVKHRIEAVSAIYFPKVTMSYKSYLTARDKSDAVITPLLTDVSLLAKLPPDTLEQLIQVGSYQKDMEIQTRKSILSCADDINRNFVYVFLNRVKGRF
ncbi:hypothetical protein [Pseudomonas sp. O39]|uniref:hypothetical protein n=1 Tax=Pseudomonas sp. O39 TaxID=3379130 RepID=UPI00387B7FF3